MFDLSKPFSNNQIDKLGERLKAGNPSDEDVTMLAAYRNSFVAVASTVANVVREISGLEVSVRSKSTKSIVEKLERDGVKQLSSMQDISGCRFTVANLAEQNDLTEKLMNAFPEPKLYDRVANPSHGYRAKHLVVKVQNKRVEIQIRTVLQSIWALFSETMADKLGQNLKYGQGDQRVLNFLHDFSATLHELDLTGFKGFDMQPSDLQNIVVTAQKASAKRNFVNLNGME